MPKGVKIAFAAVGMSTALLIAFAIVTTTSRPALATPAIAKKTGQSCAKCHTAAPTLNNYGKKYQAGQKK
jgi:mono/diheme cytochrome c family protein